MEGPRSKVPAVVFTLVIAASVATVFLLPKRGEAPRPVTPPPAEPAKQTSIPALQEHLDTPEVTPGPQPRVPTTPRELLQAFGKAVASGDTAAIERMAGSHVPPEVLDKLRKLAGEGKLTPEAIREVGELELNKRARWSLALDEEGKDRLFFDLRNENGRWTIDRVFSSEQQGSVAAAQDLLGIADSFLQAALRQEFDKAKAFVDPATVSDAKIAGLCILFEEGKYKLRDSKPIRALFERETLASMLANVEVPDGSAAGQFGINLKRPDKNGTWRISEVNLDNLLADYAKRVAGGDIYYTPLVKNPQGGDTLVLYFEFDEDSLTPRVARQLQIVAQLLKADPGKKLTITGHTDALGTGDYNSKLSARRAQTVRDYLAQAGVHASQVVTQALGDSQPRRPNFLEGGADNPEGRRANRRTEIYLDF